jgi:hypothetical protein
MNPASVFTSSGPLSVTLIQVAPPSPDKRIIDAALACMRPEASTRASAILHNVVLIFLGSPSDSDLLIWLLFRSYFGSLPFFEEPRGIQ